MNKIAGNSPVHIGKRFVVDSANFYHSHDFFEIAYIASGNVIHEIESVQKIIYEGTVLIIDQNTPHRYVATGTPATIYNCIFKPEFIHNDLLNKTNFKDIAKYSQFSCFDEQEFFSAVNQTITINKISYTNYMFNAMYYEYTNKNQGYLEMLHSYVVQLIIMAVRAYHRNTQKISQTKPNNIEIVDLIKDFIHKNYSKKLTLRKISNKLHISSSYASQIFKQYENYTIWEYLQNYRITKACELLKERLDTPINYISILCGYSDIKYFYKLFKKQIGMTPGEYRKTDSFNN